MSRLKFLLVFISVLYFITPNKIEKIKLHEHVICANLAPLRYINILEITLGSLAVKLELLVMW